MVVGCGSAFHGYLVLMILVMRTSYELPGRLSFKKNNKKMQLFSLFSLFLSGMTSLRAITIPGDMIINYFAYKIDLL